MDASEERAPAEARPSGERRRPPARPILVAFLLVALAAALGLAAWRIAMAPYPERGTDVTVDIPRGASARQVGEILEVRGVVRYRLLIPLLVRLRHGVIRAGEYHFRGPHSPQEVLAILEKGVPPPFRKVTIPEGLRIDQVAELVQLEGIGSCEELERLAADPEPIRDLDPFAWNLEGYLFPDTYHLKVDAGVADLVEAMRQRFRQVVDRELCGKEPPLPIRQWVTLASLVEEETAVEAERPLVAAVFRNRLARGMLLQCDPTIIYGFVFGGLQPREPESRDLACDSPYNTYLHGGLPPGPISSPGASALHAALHPAASEVLYFVASGDGGHVFSRTLQEHLHAVGQYRRVEVERRRAERLAAKSDRGGAAAVTR